MLLSWSSPKSEFWLLESILNQNQNKFVKGKWLQVPIKKIPPETGTEWYHTTTAANQNESAVAINAFEADTFTIWAQKWMICRGQFIIWPWVVMIMAVVFNTIWSAYSIVKNFFIFIINPDCILQVFWTI